MIRERPERERGRNRKDGHILTEAVLGGRPQGYPVGTQAWSGFSSRPFSGNAALTIPTVHTCSPSNYERVKVLLSASR